MQQHDWRGVFPAITTPFLDDLTVDHARLAKHVVWLADHGCRGIVALGSLGEAATLTFDEKISILETCKRALGDRVPLVAGIAGLSTAECVALAKRAAAVGCDGLMVLPPYVYKGDWRESKAHFEAVIRATSLSCMLYNNPIAYGTDVSPTQMRELSRHANLHAVKESSGDVRRVTAVREVNGDRLVDLRRHGRHDRRVDADGRERLGRRVWSTRCPAESVAVFELARDGRWDEARALYEWFLPLLRLDTVPKFVQLIKLVQAEVGQGNAVVRPPRLELDGAELAEVRALIRERLASRPTISTRPPARARGGRRRVVSPASTSYERIYARGAEDSARPRDDVRRDRAHGRPRSAGATGRLCAERAARRDGAAVASRDQRAGTTESRARWSRVRASRSECDCSAKASKVDAGGRVSLARFGWRVKIVASVVKATADPLDCRSG